LQFGNCKIDEKSWSNLSYRIRSPILECLLAKVLFTAQYFNYIICIYNG
jgi:hypothetical protein